MTPAPTCSYCLRPIPACICPELVVASWSSDPAKQEAARLHVALARQVYLLEGLERRGDKACPSTR